MSRIVRKMYWDDGLSLKEIARILNTYPQKVWRVMKANGIPCRTEGAAKTLHYDKADKYFMNESFFEKWSEDMAWVLGLWYSDGHIWKDCSRAALAAKDREFLEQVRDLMGSNFRISKLWYVWQLVMNRPYRVQKLMRWGLAPAKSKSCLWPDVPDIFLPHFVRGVWDGDGTISIRREGWLSISHECGSEQFSHGLRDCLANLLGRPVYFTVRDRPHRQYRGRVWNNCAPVYSIRIHGAAALTICRWMYMDSKSTNRLGRKYEIIRQRL